MKSFSDRPFRVNAIPRHRGCVLVHRSLRRVPRRYVHAIHVQWGRVEDGAGKDVLGRSHTTEIARCASQLGHLGAMVGQHHRAVRPAEYSCEIDDFQPGQRAGTII